MIGLEWTNDSKAIDYVVHKAKASNVWRQPLDGTQPYKITDFDTGLIFNFAASGDGKRFAFARESFQRDVVLIAMPE